MPTLLPYKPLPPIAMLHLRLQLKVRKIRRHIRTKIAKYLIWRACRHVDKGSDQLRRALKIAPWVKPSDFDFRKVKRKPDGEAQGDL